MKENQQRIRKYNAKKIPFDNSNMKKYRYPISNNNQDKVNSQQVTGYKYNNEKKILAKHNSNNKLADKIIAENNMNKYTFMQNIRNKYKNNQINKVKNSSHNEIFSNKSINDMKPKTEIKNLNSTKNYSLNKSKVSSSNKNAKKPIKISSSLEKRIKSYYLIPNTTFTSHFKSQKTKNNENNDNDLTENYSNEKPKINTILSKYYHQNNFQNFQNNDSSNNNRIDKQKISQPNSNMIKQENENKFNEFKYNSYNNFLGESKISTKIEIQKPSEINKYLRDKNKVENENKTNIRNKYLLKSNKSNDNFIKEPYKNTMNNGKTPIEKKIESLISQNEKEEETDANITKKLNNIIENLKKQKKNKMNKFINVNNPLNDNLIIQQYRKIDGEENLKRINENNEKINLEENKIKNEQKIIQRNINDDEFINKSKEQKSYEINGINKNLDFQKDFQRYSDKKEENKSTDNFYPLNRENKTIYKVDNIIKNENNNKNFENNFEQINSNILSHKQNIKYRQSGLINNRFYNNDIIKINLDNLKNKYLPKKDLDKINEKQNVPQLVTQSLTGLVNLGETCYMNTGLQNLIHCVPFINELFTLFNEEKELIEEKIISKSFINLCLSLIKIDNYNLKYNFNSYNPSAFRLNFCRCHKQYFDHEQHDSLEFLRILLDDISKELNQTKVITQYKELSTEGKTKEQQNKEYNEFYLCREDSIVVKIFYSQIMNIFICECGDISYSFEKLLDIPLLFPKEINNKEINLNDLISQYFNGEELTWNLSCQKCQKKDMKRNKKIKITILPKVLIFSLQRFNPITGVKINKYINFDEIIDLQPFCDNDFFNGEMNAKYKLFGISNHSGTLNFGHYYSYTKVGDNWFEFNDSLVKMVNVNFFSKAAYFFFYEKIE